MMHRIILIVLFFSLSSPIISLNLRHAEVLFFFFFAAEMHFTTAHNFLEKEWRSRTPQKIIFFLHTRTLYLPGLCLHTHTRRRRRRTLGRLLSLHAHLPPVSGPLEEGVGGVYTSFSRPPSPPSFLERRRISCPRHRSIIQCDTGQERGQQSIS